MCRSFVIKRRSGLAQAVSYGWLGPPLTLPAPPTTAVQPFRTLALVSHQSRQQPFMPKGRTNTKRNKTAAAAREKACDHDAPKCQPNGRQRAKLGKAFQNYRRHTLDKLKNIQEMARLFKIW